jgi:hypothetical protein
MNFKFFKLVAYLGFSFGRKGTEEKLKNISARASLNYIWDEILVLTKINRFTLMAYCLIMSLLPINSF